MAVEPTRGELSPSSHEEPARADFEHKVLMSVMAHPDDSEFSSGGTIAKFVREGWEAHYVMCTSGQKGSADPEMTSERLSAIRQREQRNACDALGVKTVTFLGGMDGELQPTMELRGAIVRMIRTYRPTILFTHDGWAPYQFHSDHLAAGIAAFHGSFSARDRLYFPEHEAAGLGPWKVREIYLFGSPNPDVVIDISETIDTKIQALMQHVSQVGGREDLAGFVRRNAATAGEEAGLSFAERFKRVICRP